MPLPDFEAWAIFTKVVRTGSFSQAAAELGLSKATISKAVARLEERLGAVLLQRTSRRFVLTEIGRNAVARAERMLLEAEGAEFEAATQAAMPRGRVRLTTPVQFGIDHIAPLLPQVFAAYPDLTIDLHLSDQVEDVIAGGFDLAVRIGALADSSLRVRRLCDVRIIVVGSPDYFERHGHPSHPHDLAAHRCFTYAYQSDPHRWRFFSDTQQEATVAPQGPFRANSGEAFLPALRSGCGIAVLPEFIVWRDVAAGRLCPTMCDWRVPPVGLNLVMPPGTRRPMRVDVVADVLAAKLAAAPWAKPSPNHALHGDAA